MNSEVAWVQVSSGTQVQPQIILDPDYLPDYVSVSYDYVSMLSSYYDGILLDSLTIFRKSSVMDL